MKKLFLTIALSLTCALGLSLSARAQDDSRVVVNVPFDFVAGGKALPAGTYTFGRVSVSSQRDLVIHSYDNGAFLLPTAFDDAPVDQAKVEFAHVGDKYFLSTVETLAGVYTFGMPRAISKVAQVKDQVALSSSGTH